MTPQDPIPPWDDWNSWAVLADRLTQVGDPRGPILPALRTLVGSAGFPRSSRRSALGPISSSTTRGNFVPLFFSRTCCGKKKALKLPILSPQLFERTI